MGQRLNIEIKNNKEVLANCYFHWSGYSKSSLIITKLIIEYLKNNNVSFDKKGCVNIFESIGASFNQESFSRAKELGIVSGDFIKCNGRNDGLISVDEIGMQNTRKWEEGRIEINIENKTFNFKCAWEKNYMDDDDIWEKISNMFYEIKDIESRHNIPFEKIDILIDGIKKAQDEYSGRFYFGYSCYNSIY